MKKGVDYIGVSIVYFCHDGRGNIIMAKRSHNARDERGRWDIGGGALEFTDTVENTLKKEIAEEYSVNVISFESLGYRDVHRKVSGIKTHWIALDFKVLVDPKGLKIGEPHKFEDIGWFTLDNHPTPVHSQLPTFFQLYAHKLR